MRPLAAKVPPRVRRWAVRFGGAIAIAVALAYIPYRLLDPDGARQVSALESQLVRARADQHRLRQENARYAVDVARLRDEPAAVEEVARHDLGMVWPDEIVIRVDVEKDAR